MIANVDNVWTAAEFLADVKRMIEEKKPVGFDIESGYLGPDKEGVALLPHHPDWILVSFSYANDKNVARSVPIAFDNGDNIDNPTLAARVLWKLLNEADIVAHNAPFELAGASRWFREMLWDDRVYGAAVQMSDGLFPIYGDTYVEAKVANMYHPIFVGAGLKGLSKHVLGQEMNEFRSLFPPEDTDMGPGTKKNKLKMIRFNTRNPRSPRILQYCCEDSTATLELDEHFRPILMESEMKPIFNIEMQMQPVLIGMEKEALVLDWKAVHEKAIEIAQFRDRFNEQIQADLSARTGNAMPVLLSSPKQLADVLFKPIDEGGLGLPVKKRSKKTKAPSTGNDAMKLIAQKDSIIRDILTWRRVAKLYSSYLNKYDTQLNYAGNGRAYPNHNQLGAGTGRMSVDGVSYQQWPKPYHFELRDGTSFDLNFRDLLETPEGWRLVGFDYSQVELRILAGAAQEDVMMAAFRDGVDIHRATASTMLRIPLEQITKKHRGVGKTINFAVVYGSGPEGIADGLSAAGTPTTKEQAAQMLKEYFAAFPKLRAYMDTLIRTGREQGFVMTPFNRKFTVWEFSSPFDSVRKKGERLCVNAPIQGGAADYLKMSMIRVDTAIKGADMQDKIRMVLSVHDHLGFYVRNDVTDQQVIELIDPAVTSKDRQLGGVPILADWHVGKKWGHVVEIKRHEDGTIKGYINEDDDQMFDTPEEAYERGLVLDAERMERYRIKIEERLAAQVERDAVNEKFSEIVTELTHEFEPGGDDDNCRICGEEFDYFEHALATPIDESEEGFADTPHRFEPGGDDDGCQLCGENPHAYLHTTWVAKQKARREAVPEPVPEDVLSAIDAMLEEPVPEAEVKTPIPEDSRIDHSELSREYYLRYHREADNGENVRAWLNRIGVSIDQAREEEPPWAHAGAQPVPEPVSAPTESAYVITIDEMPDGDVWTVFENWLAKDDGASSIRVVVITPEGQVEIGRTKADRARVEKASRLILGSLEEQLLEPTREKELI